MKKAFFINGGVGRVLCAIPALEYYAKNTDPEVVIVCEGWMELFLASPTLRNNVYPVNHKNLLKDKLIDKELVSPEPYRLNAYFNQKVNLIQAFDMIINDLKEIPETKKFNLEIGKGDQVHGYNFADQVKQQFQKEKLVVFQPFGSGARMHGRFIIDESGRSFELRDILNMVEELGKHYAVIMFTDIKIPVDKPMPAVIPEQMNLLQWMSIVNACDYFLGCDSVGQHFANALGKPATVVIGSTYPENITYPDNKNFTIIDNGKDKRSYSPIRITMDFFIDRSNEDLMILDQKTFDKILKSVTDKLGTSSNKKNSAPNYNQQSMCCSPQPSIEQIGLGNTVKDVLNNSSK